MFRWSFGTFLCVSLLAIASIDRDVLAANPEKPSLEVQAKSKVVHVTVYPNSALITREVTVPEGMGAMELVVSGLPETTVNSSLYSEGTEGLRILSTRFRTRPVQEDAREEVRKITDELKQLQQAMQKIDSETMTVTANLLLVTKLEGFTAADTKNATEKGTLNAETIIALAKHVMERRAELNKEQVVLLQQKQEKQEMLEFKSRQLRELTTGRSRTERDAILVVDKTNRAEGKARLNYLVDAAAWRPQYKLRAGKDEKEAVQIEYLASIVQQTGESWDSVSLTLSTAEPMLNAAPPDMKMLEVAVINRGANFSLPGANSIPTPQQTLQQSGNFNPNNSVQGKGYIDLDNDAKQLRQQAQGEFKKKQETSGGSLINAAAALEQANELLNYDSGLLAKNNKRVTTNREGPSVTYHLKNKLSIPSRNDEQTLEVARLEMTPEFFYKAVPVLSPHVYRLANLTNKSDHVLLPGEATMYQGTDFVGRMNLPLVAVGEQFTAGFGADPQLQVQRQLIEKNQTMSGGNQVLKYEYRILLSSYKTQQVNLQLWDRLPLAENEKTVVVVLGKAQPEVSSDPLYLREQRPKNMLRWDLKVDPTMSGEKALTVNYDFRMELDKQMTISSVGTK